VHAGSLPVKIGHVLSLEPQACPRACLGTSSWAQIGLACAFSIRGSAGSIGASAVEVPAALVSGVSSQWNGTARPSLVSPVFSGLSKCFFQTRSSSGIPALRFSDKTFLDERWRPDAEPVDLLQRNLCPFHPSPLCHTSIGEPRAEVWAECAASNRCPG
jgi:hypothetical protein